ncbi:mannosyl-oligosaccharide alpha-1,2-mannosidase [Rhizoctonia solani]|uniref:alpha-1,2-Mannosidase n=1 Tax=Rhizoctonia solani TaxID=456999 RepID=A0A0K6GDR4_9AGAM|nr:mannosyl-oligosaccharide alpha-1,2-mannosidase [Rhizoctonia solani]
MLKITHISYLNYGWKTAFILVTLRVTSARNIQKPDLQLPADAAENAQHTIEIFKSAYQSYKSVAWGHDSLAPLTNSYIDDRNGWGATIVDSLSTMHIMGLKDWFEEGVEFTLGIDFSRSKTDSTISLFESTIRYIGGILSAYELDGKKDKRLVDKAKELAEKLVYAWVDNNDIPYNELNFTTNRPIIEETGLAVAGTLVLEWSRLSEYTGDAKYRELPEKAMHRLTLLPAPFPSLPVQMVDPKTNKPNGTYVTWGGGSDSYFEYLIKYGRLTNNANTLWTKQWLTAVDSSIIHLAQEAVDTDIKGLLYLGEWYNGTFRHLGSHLACFHGGNWIMGGRLTDNDTIVDYGLRLTDTCWNTYERTATGLGPEVFGFVGPDGNKAGKAKPSSSDLAYYKENGFYSYNDSMWSYYDLRPEVLESNFYAWRATGDIKYQQRAHAALLSIEKYCKVDGGYVGINDVRLTEQDSYINQTETFLFAEVLKYLYLTFADPQTTNLDEWVMNTEAHPLMAPPPLDTYAIARWVGPVEPFRLRAVRAAVTVARSAAYLKALAWIVAIILLGTSWRLRHRALKVE